MNGFRFGRTASAILAAGCLIPAAYNPSAAIDPVTQRQAARTADVSQAWAMVAFLEGVAKKEHVPEHLDAVMDAKGTGLIVAQMNLVRKATAEQYRMLLEGLVKGEMPEIQPVDSSLRAQRGVDALTKDVWLALNWGLEHTDVLRQRIGSIRQLDFYDLAYSKAVGLVPGQVSLSPNLSIVAGGRAGAAQLGEADIYLDVLVLDGSRTIRNEPLWTNAELINLVSHEMHHMAYQQVLGSFKAALTLDARQEWILHLLSSLVSEGSATYLVSEDRDIRRMRRSRNYAGYLENEGELLGSAETVIRAILEGRINTTEEYENATADFLGHWTHSAGSLLLSAIDAAGALDKIMEVLADPRKLLSAYNRAVRLGDSQDYGFRFDDDLAAKVLQIGN